MQKFHCLLLYITLAFPVIAFGRQVTFADYTGWQPLLKKARQEHKKIVIYFHASWCVPCKAIEKTIFTDSLVYNLLNNAAVNIAVDIDKPGAVELVKKYRVVSVPVMAVLNNEGYLLEKNTTLPAGNAAAFYTLLKSDLEKKEVLPGVSNRLDLHYPAFYNDYFAGNRKTPPDSQQVHQYLQQQHDLFAEVNWCVRSVFANNVEDMNVLLRNYDRLEHLYGKEVNAMITGNYAKVLRYLVQKKDSSAFGQLLHVYSSRMNAGDKITAEYFQWTQFLGRSGMDWPRFQQLVMEYNRLYGKKYNYSFCQVMYRNCHDSLVCDYMSTLMSEIVIDKATPNACIIYATLLLKSNQKQLADTWFSKALDLADNTEKRNRYAKQIETIKAETPN